MTLRRPARIAAALAVAALWSVSLGSTTSIRAHAKEDYRGALRLVAARAGPARRCWPWVRTSRSTITIVAASPWTGCGRATPPEPGRLEEELEDRLSGARGTWIVLSRPEDLDAEGVFVRTLGARHPEAEEFRFGGVRVWHVRP